MARREAVKRKNNPEAGHGSHKPKETKTDDDDDRPLCRYGESCYQKNAHHLSRFLHPHREVFAAAKTEADAVQSTKHLVVGESKTTPAEAPAAASSSGDRSTGDPDETLPGKTPPQHSEEEEEDLPPSPSDVKENIRQKYLVEMPPDFFALWDFCKQLNSDNPTGALKELVGIELVGPFQLLGPTARGDRPRKLSHYLTQWRFYYDPPEFQCVAVGDPATGYHIGYFRDDPKEMPSFVASSTEAEGCIITPIADNLLSSISLLVSERLKRADPFLKTALLKLKKQLEDVIDENGEALKRSARSMKERRKRVVAKTFYHCGIVVPVDKKTDVGYRKIPETDDKIKKICKKIVDSENEQDQDENFEKLQELVTFVQYANDEMDYGMGLELGLDLLAYGGEIFHSTITHLLCVAYDLLERPEFAVILKAHLKCRRKMATALQIRQVHTPVGKPITLQ